MNDKQFLLEMQVTTSMQQTHGNIPREEREKIMHKY